MFQSKIDLGSKEAPNVDLDVIWETLLPKLVANQNLRFPNHQS
jgi:hypothetical protein